MSTRDVSVSDYAVARGRKQGLYGETSLRLKRMARRSATVTSDHGNRRFHDWFLHIRDGIVLDVTRVYPSQPSH